MYRVDKETGEIIAEVTDSTLEQEIDYTNNVKKMLKNSSNREIVTLHTHPSSMPPSVADFNSCLKNGYSEGFVACHNGKIFGYKSEEIISDKLFELYFNEKFTYNFSEYDAQIKSIKEIMKDYKIKFWEVK
jgi:proteasome lid subunit RPN8/RPN11